MLEQDRNERVAKPVAPASSSINLSMISSMGIAIAIHVIIALAVGSYVVFEGIVPVPFFESDFVDTNQTSMIEEVPTLIEEEPLPAVASTQVETVVEEVGGADAPDMSDLITVTSATSTPSFSMPTTAGNPGLLTGSLLGGSGSGTGTGVGKGKVKLGSLFGSRNLGAGVLTGYLYDYKQDPSGKATEVAEFYDANRGTSERHQAFRGYLAEFLKKWDERELDKYYRTKEPLSTTQILIPAMAANGAPAAFDVANEVEPSAWVILYKGNITPPHNGSFRFVGRADDIILIRVDGKVVFDGNLGIPTYPDAQVERLDFGFGSDRAGDWIRLRSGETYPIEILLSEVPGGSFFARLCIQEKGVEYPTSADGKLMLPPFQMMPTEIPSYFQGKVMEDGPVFGAE
jgi:hypothetical protein